MSRGGASISLEDSGNGGDVRTASIACASAEVMLAKMRHALATDIVHSTERAADEDEEFVAQRRPDRGEADAPSIRPRVPPAERAIALSASTGLASGTTRGAQLLGQNQKALAGRFDDSSTHNRRKRLSQI